MCKHLFCRMPPMERWDFLAMRVRCALYADDPRAIDQLFTMGGYLHEQGDACAWDVARKTAMVLLDTAEDTALPWQWRCQCLDHVARPLGVMQHIGRMSDAPPHLSSEYRRITQALMQRLSRLDIHRESW